MEKFWEVRPEGFLGSNEEKFWTETIGAIIMFTLVNVLLKLVILAAALEATFLR